MAVAELRPAPFVLLTVRWVVGPVVVPVKVTASAPAVWVVPKLVPPFVLRVPRCSRRFLP